MSHGVRLLTSFSGKNCDGKPRYLQLVWVWGSEMHQPRRCIFVFNVHIRRVPLLLNVMAKDNPLKFNSTLPHAQRNALRVGPKGTFSVNRRQWLRLGAPPGEVG
jgi:hypothetical protein